MKPIMIVLLIILIVFVISGIICDYYNYDMINGDFIDSEMHRNKPTTHKLLYSCAEGMVRGILLGGITTGIPGAVAYSISLGILNPTMLLILYQLPEKSLFRP